MKIHMVKKGDTLYLIAQKYNVPLEELIKANPEIANPDEIDVGMKVKIPAPAKPTFELMHQHTVQQGDSLWKLSKAWGIPLSVMIQANPQLKNPNVLLTGEVVNIPKLGAAVPADGLTMQSVHAGKKNTAVKPDTGVVVEPAPLPAPLPEMPAPLPMPEPIKMPLPEMPVMQEPIKMPLPDLKNPYPMPYEHDHDLFAQMHIPAVEAGAVAPTEVPVNAAPESAYAHDYGYPYGHAYMHDYGMHHPYAFYGHSYGSIEGAMGSVYDPQDISGFNVNPAGFGDLSTPGTAVSPASGTGVTGYLPAYVPGLVAPAAAGAGKPGCKTCGGTPAASVTTPMLPAAPTAVSPAMTGPFPGMMPGTMTGAFPEAVYPTAVSPATAFPETGFPTAVSPASAYPNVPYPTAVSPVAAFPSAGFPTAVSPEAAYPVMGYPTYPTAVSPYETMPYVHDAYAYPYDHFAHYPVTAPVAGYPTNIAPAAVVPGYPYPLPAFPVEEDCFDPVHAGYYGYPYAVNPLGIPALRPEEQTAPAAASELSLHASEGDADPAAAAQPKKRHSASAKKQVTVRRSKPKRKESLPWIKW